MEKRLFLFLILFFGTALVYGQNMLGRWYAQLGSDSMAIHYLFDLRKNGEQFLGYLDLPSSQQFRVGLDSVRISETGNLYAEQAGLELSFKGSYHSDDHTINGILTNKGVTDSLVLHRTPRVKRTQLIKQPYPYASEEVFFYNQDSIRFGGTLTIPKGEGPFPAVILISGSGPQNRDEEILGHRPFKVLADHLSRNGVIVLRYDDRGYGDSGGRFRPATSMDYTFDALGAVNFLKQKTDLKIDKIGLAGHSEGGNIAPVAATMDEAVDFLILLAAPGLSNYASYLISLDLIFQDYPETYDRDFPFFKSVYYDMANIKDKKVLKDSLQAKFTRISQVMEADELQMYGGAEGYIQGQVAYHSSDWYHYYLQFDVSPYLEQLKIPILALNGDKDISVEAQSNLEGIRATLSKSDNPHFETVRLANVNHFFQTSESDKIEDVYFNEVSFAEEALNKILAWIKELD